MSYVAYFSEINMDNDGVDDEGRQDLQDDEDGEEDIPEDDDMDPLLAELLEQIELEYDDDGDFANHKWDDYAIVQNPTVQIPFVGPRPAPYFQETPNGDYGARNLPVGTATCAQYFELYYTDEVNNRFVQQTNSAVRNSEKPA